MIDAVSIKIHAINAYGNRKHAPATVSNLRDFGPDYVQWCLRRVISSPVSTPGQRVAAQKALEEL